MTGRSFTVTKIGDELANAVHIREALASEGDPKLILDMIEGSTELHEAIAVVYEDIAEDEMLASGIKATMGLLDERKSRLEKSVEARRNIILMAMDKAGIETIKTPRATISARQSPPLVIITDETLIPARFFRAQDPRLDKKTLNEAVKGGEVVPGAELTNGGIGLSVRKA